MDFVPNHSSDQHDWFQRSIRREEPYTDYYIWKDAAGMDGEGNPIPPNNWVSEMIHMMMLSLAQRMAQRLLLLERKMTNRSAIGCEDDSFTHATFRIFLS